MNSDSDCPHEKSGSPGERNDQNDSGNQLEENIGAVKSERHTGSCKWFNVLKGFGFIILDNTLEDVFVHQSELKMEGFRSLEEGERVSFFVRTRNSGQRVGALEAWQVGPEDESKSLIGSSIRPLGAKKDRMIRFVPLLFIISHACVVFLFSNREVFKQHTFTSIVKHNTIQR
ncbi:unnamed protein product [Angiostrongylus costaricensis]|uniref:CSD_1 domain-containing protein n=1 Tax=Angiostrongylus costaricensis TaxID=334426 RepID=A0A0R3PJM8_ANGCS|nr:unnamed protein product [Angiostrongylus costaricensis]